MPSILFFNSASHHSSLTAHPPVPPPDYEMSIGLLRDGLLTSTMPEKPLSFHTPSSCVENVYSDIPSISGKPPMCFISLQTSCHVTEPGCDARITENGRHFHSCTDMSEENLCESLDNKQAIFRENTINEQIESEHASHNVSVHTI